MRFFIRCLVIILLNVAVQRAEAKKLKVAFGFGRPPYAYQQNGKWAGIEVEVVGEVLRRMGHVFEAEHISALRLEAEARHGNRFDLVVGVPQDKEGSVFYSNPYVWYDNYAVSLKKRNLRIHSVKDLTNLKVGTWMNAWRDLGPGFRANFGPRVSGIFPSNYREFVKQEDQCLAFWKGKVDVVIVDKHVFNWFRLTLAHKVDTSQDVQMIRIFHTARPVYVAFHEMALRDAFDVELAKLLRSGEYDRIVRSHVGGEFVGFKQFEAHVR